MDDVKVTDPPEQKVVAPPAEIAGVEGNGFTLIVILAEEAHCPEFGVNV